MGIRGQDREVSAWACGAGSCASASSERRARACALRRFRFSRRAAARRALFSSSAFWRFTASTRHQGFNARIAANSRRMDNAWQALRQAALARPIPGVSGWGKALCRPGTATQSSRGRRSRRTPASDPRNGPMGPDRPEQPPKGGFDTAFQPEAQPAVARHASCQNQPNSYRNATKRGGISAGITLRKPKNLNKINHFCRIAFTIY